MAAYLNNLLQSEFGRMKTMIFEKMVNNFEKETKLPVLNHPALNSNGCRKIWWFLFVTCE